MLKTHGLTLALTATALTALTALPFGQDAAIDELPEPEAVLAQMDWLAGSWSGDMWGGRFEAYYTTPEGGKIISHSRLFTDGQESFYEFEVFEVDGDVLRLQPYPGGRRAGGFTLASYDAAEREAVFENPDKDYPTRIVYRRADRSGGEGVEEVLEAVLSDPFGGSDKTDRFVLERVE